MDTCVPTRRVLTGVLSSRLRVELRVRDCVAVVRPGGGRPAVNVRTRLCPRALIVGRAVPISVVKVRPKQKEDNCDCK